jgi:hypothetical protein
VAVVVDQVGDHHLGGARHLAALDAEGGAGEAGGGGSILDEAGRSEGDQPEKRERE